MAEAKTKSGKKAPADDTFKVQVRKGTVLSEPATTQTDAPKEEKQDLKMHHELVLEAPELSEKTGDDTNKPTPNEATPPAEPPKEKLAPDPAPDVQATEPANVPSAEDKPATEAPLGAAPENPQQDMQSPTVFDTKQYHLPINESHASGSHKAVWVFVLLLILVVGALAAVDAEYIDLGFKLPFDLIK